MREVVYEGRHVKVVSADGWEYVTRRRVSGVVVIAALTADGKLILVSQHRKPVDRTVIELPAGLAGDIEGQEQEALETAARRELLEETGYEADHMECVTAGPASAGLTDEFITFFIARGLRKVSDGGGDGHEDICVHEVPLDSLDQWLEGRVRDGWMIDYKIWVGVRFLQR